MRTQHNQDGITLLVTLLLMGVLLGISASLLNVTIKQFQLSGISLASETAFQAANAGMECALFHDFPVSGVGLFEVNGNGTTVPEEGSISCMNTTSSDIEPSSNGTVVSSEEQRFRFDWSGLCTEVSVYKFYSTTGPVPITVDGIALRATPCPAGGVCTVVQSRGYNVACGQITSGSRVVEREYTQIY